MLYTKLFSAKLLAATTIVTLLMSTPMPTFLAYAQEETLSDTPQTQTQDAPPADPGQNGDNGTDQQGNRPAGDGQTGGDGTNAADKPTDPINGGSTGEAAGAPSVVETGDAAASTDSGNNENANTINTGNASTTIDANNNAGLDNQSTTTAATGDNTAAGGGGSGVISTGDAYASGNAINVVNTNVIDSSGMLLFLNLLFGQGFDLRDFDLSYFFGGGGQNGCSLTGCNNANLTVNADNTATVTNSTIVRAITGGNDCTGQADCTIQTGDAYASGNAVNLVNSNIINSNYLLVTLNNFGNLAGDITLPGADFFQQLLAMQNQQSGSLSVNANNNATVTDGTSATAATGDNTASTTDGNAEIQTGNAIAGATTFNQVNSNLIGGTQIFLLFRVWGDFTGNIQGLPNGMMWEQTPFGIVLKNADGSAAPTSALGNSGCSSCGGSTAINTTNTATLNNNLQVFALTGENKATTASGTAAISTGNAYAAANSVNIVNSNIIGRNWIFMIFNIFGNFSGNIAFGHPDLWIGASADTANPTIPNSPINFHFTVANRGDSDATNVKINAKFAKELLRFTSGLTNDGAVWDLGDIPRGTTKEFVFTATTGAIPSSASAAAPLDATVTSDQTDNNMQDNSEHIDVVIVNPAVDSWSGPGRAPYTTDPDITIQKISSTVATSAPAAIDYAIVIDNDGGDAYNVVLTDTLMGPGGTYVGDQSWKLGTVRSGENIRVTYTVQYGSDIPLGYYKNTARLTGQKNNAVKQYATDMMPVETSNIVEIRPKGEVLTPETQRAMCAPYLLEYIRPNHNNKPSEVKKLQTFLNKNDNETLAEDGRFDGSTIDAVKRFQARYASEILTPWGITQPTGAVYFTTKKKINELYCDGGAAFNLTNDQMQEMDTFRNALPPYKADKLNKWKVGDIPSPIKDVSVPTPIKDAKAGLPAVQPLEIPKDAPATTSALLLAPLQWISSWLMSVVPVAHAAER